MPASNHSGAEIKRAARNAMSIRNAGRRRPRRRIAWICAVVRRSKRRESPESLPRVAAILGP